MDEERHSARGPAAWAEQGWLPDAAIRLGIRRALRERLRQQRAGGPAAIARRLDDFAAQLAASEVALLPEAANAQHYEVPAAFFEQVLGPRLKYSCALYDSPGADLPRAEERMLAASCERAGLEDGMQILELGCGWGSLTLWMAEQYPQSPIVAVSNSKGQREQILGQCERRGLRNVEVLTADVNHFDTGTRFDRVVSVEMFEHVRNWPRLLSRIRGWLAPEGRLFVHHFCHGELAYPYEDRGPGDWMARNFFSGGIMPSADLLDRFQEDLVVEERWRVDGTHYQRTCEDWLRNLDARREAALGILARSEPALPARRALGRWRIFILACAELFGFQAGAQWWVRHARLAPRGA